jgi:heme exporter protein CcmD
MPVTARIEFIAAYGAGVVVIVVLIAWVMLDYRLQRRIIAELETKGVSRRSAAFPQIPLVHKNRESTERTATADA